MALVVKSIDYSGLFQTMQEKGLTSYRLSKDWDIPQKTFYNMRQGKTVTIETIFKLSFILETPVDKLVRMEFARLE